MKYRYEFVGGRMHGKHLTPEMAGMLADGKSKDWSIDRDRGRLVPRAELDNQPTFNGYLGPMWDGLRYEVDGHLRYEFELTEVQKMGKAPIAVLRYETQEVYDMLSR